MGRIRFSAVRNGLALLAIVVLLVIVAAPFIGLGSNEQFVLYRGFGVSRSFAAKSIIFALLASLVLAMTYRAAPRIRQKSVTVAHALRKKSTIAARGLGFILLLPFRIFGEIKRYPALWGMSAALCFATMIKPVAGVLFWIALAVLWAFRLQRAYVLFKVGLAYMVVMLVWTWLYWANSPARIAPLHPTPNPESFAAFLVHNPLSPLLGPPNSYLGLHFLMKFYRYREFVSTGQSGARDWLIGDDRPNLLDPESAAAASLRAFALRYPQYLGVSKECLDEFGGSMDRFVAWLLDNSWHSPHCSGSAMGWIFNGLQLEYGEEQASKMMLQTALATVAREPFARRMMLGDWLQSTVLPSGATQPSMGIAGIRDEVEEVLIGSIRSAIPNHLPEAMKRDVGVVGERPEWAKTVNAVLDMQDRTFRAAKPWFFGIMIVGGAVLIWRRAPAAPLIAFLILAYLGSATVWNFGMIMPGSDPRHEAVFTVLPLLAVPVIIAGLWKRQCQS
jgi:hypothetical protein